MGRVIGVLEPGFWVELGTKESGEEAGYQASLCDLERSMPLSRL